jgi:pyridoxal phosphate enzyme (YggS family)
VTAPSAAEVADRAEAVRERIRRAGGDPDQVRLLAVTKGFDAAAVRAALAAGLLDVGENYAQELLAKAEALATAGAAEARPAPRWHFVGRLQSNKIRKLAPYVDLWQSVDRLTLGTEIARRAPGAAVLAQVNLTDETTKGGCPPAELPGLLDGLRALELDVRGLMTVGPLDAPETARPAFRELRRLSDEHGLAERSMGMSEDLEVAVEEGTTMVRVGTALFGPRPGAREMRH